MNPSSLAGKFVSGPTVFVSHSHKDEIYARKIVAWLEKLGCNPWASFEECSDKFRVEIDKALLDCNVFLLMGSENSFESIEVRREIGVAGSLHKPISYYRLDSSSHNREGFLTLLSEKQYIQASRKNLELEKLAENIFETWDGNKDGRTREARNDLIRHCLAIEEANYEKWREKLWSLRIDSNNYTRKLSSADRDILQQEADRLALIICIDDESESFALNKLAFTRDLTSIIAKRKIDKAMLSQIEKKRFECFVPKALAIDILEKRLSKVDYLNDINISKNAGMSDHWLVSQIKTMQGKGSESFGGRTMDSELSDSFAFKHSIYPLESYVAGASDIKMSLISLVRHGQRLSFSGLQGLTPFSFQSPDPVTEFSVGAELVRLIQKGYKTYIVIRVSNSSDFESLLTFMKNFAILVEHADTLGAQNKSVPQNQNTANEETSGHAADKFKAEAVNSDDAIVWIFLAIVFVFIWILGAGLRSLGSFFFHLG
jgi:hypothetical protein